jgi:hypothetical protein
VVDLAVEDQADLVRAADVEVVADHLLEEDPARQRPGELPRVFRTSELVLFHAAAC